MPWGHLLKGQQLSYFPASLATLFQIQDFVYMCAKKSLIHYLQRVGSSHMHGNDGIDTGSRGVDKDQNSGNSSTKRPLLGRPRTRPP